MFLLVQWNQSGRPCDWPPWAVWLGTIFLVHDLLVWVIWVKVSKLLIGFTVQNGLKWCFKIYKVESLHSKFMVIEFWFWAIRLHFDITHEIMILIALASNGGTSKPPQMCRLGSLSLSCSIFTYSWFEWKWRLRAKFRPLSADECVSIGI